MFQQLELIKSKSSVRLGILNLRNTGGSYMYMYMQQGNINATTNKLGVWNSRYAVFCKDYIHRLNQINDGKLTNSI